MDDIREEIEKLKTEKNAVILAHTYQPGDVQDIADYVGDSYGLSVQATEAEADVIVFAGVKFMAETAAILSPQKKVIMPVKNAGCPLADMITPDELEEYKKEYSDYVVMCYVNSSAEIKAMSDICCTSSNALKIAKQIPEDKGIIFVPDKHLGGWIQEQTGRRMALWEGFCPTHTYIKLEMIQGKKEKHPSAKVLIHPEVPKESRDLADEVLSTGGMCRYVKENTYNEYIIATEIGIIHTLQKQNPEKSFHIVDESIVCPNMRKGSLEAVYKSLMGTGGITITVPKDIADKALGALKKMLEMSR